LALTKSKRVSVSDVFYEMCHWSGAVTPLYNQHLRVGSCICAFDSRERKNRKKREEKRREREERGREERRREEREGKRRKKKEEKEKKEERMCWTRSSAEIILDFAIEGKYCMICIQNII
jgi:hypothetical protein